MKVCSKCKQAKELACFLNCKSSRDGLAYRCRTCAAADAKAWRERNKEHVRAYEKNNREENREAHIAACLSWRERNPEKVKDYNKKAYAENAESRRTGAKEYYYLNRDKFLERHSENNKNPEVMAARKAYNKAYNEKNRDEIRAKSRSRKPYNNMKAAERREMKRRSSMRLSECHLSQIQDIYWLAKDVAHCTGEPYEVDHIVPIKGKGICGLHVPWNLQILPQDLNRSKSNRYKEGDAFAFCFK